MKTRIIYTNFWKDNYISGITAKEKLAFIYLITNDSVSICGIYQLPDKHIRMDLDLTTGEWEAIKSKFTKDGKFYFHEGWVKILNFGKYNKYSGDMNEKAINRELSTVPDHLIQYQYSIDTVCIGVLGVPNTLNNQNQNKNHKSKPSLESLRTFLEYFNEQSGKSYQVTDDRAAALEKRLKKYSMEQLKLAIDALLKSPHHIGKNKTETWYATPDFLLRDDEMVDRWLNASTPAKLPVTHKPMLADSIL